MVLKKDKIVYKIGKQSLERGLLELSWSNFCSLSFCISHTIIETD